MYIVCTSDYSHLENSMEIYQMYTWCTSVNMMLTDVHQKCTTENLTLQMVYFRLRRGVVGF